MAFTDAIDVDVGGVILASTTDNLADNTEFNREKSDVDHDFDISTGDGKHKTVQAEVETHSNPWAKPNTPKASGTGTAGACQFFGGKVTSLSGNSTVTILDSAQGNYLIELLFDFGATNGPIASLKALGVADATPYVTSLETGNAGATSPTMGVTTADVTGTTGPSNLMLSVRDGIIEVENNTGSTISVTWRIWSI